MRTLLLTLTLALSFVGSGCGSHVPPTLSPNGAVVWRANQVVVGLGTLQHAAIELNKQQLCEPAPCRPLLSDKDTGTVVDVVGESVKAIGNVPAGWKQTALAALATIEARLEAAGKQRIRAYIVMAETVINEVQ